MFNFNEVQENSGFYELKDGYYEMIVEKTEMKNSQSGGKYINATFKVFDSSGLALNCKHFEIYNIENSNEKAVEIGMGNYKALMIKTGKYPKDGIFKTVEALLNCPIGGRFRAKIKITSDGARNNARITSYTESELTQQQTKQPSKDEIPW